MNAETIKKLKSLAEAATPGKWESSTFVDNRESGSDHHTYKVTPQRGVYGSLFENDAAYIAAASPATILDLLTRLSRAEEERDHPKRLVPCPCTMIEQGEDCPVGYPSMICGACEGKGVTTQEKVTALAVEMISIANDCGEPEDPFAAWETVELWRSERDQLRKALEWQPIETAPKDGTRILIWFVHANARFSPDPVADGWVAAHEAYWIDHNGGGWTWHGLCGVATRWQPLPTPPALSGATS